MQEQIYPEELERKIGHRFQARKWLITALTHKSFVNENPEPAAEHNERLEFLGDAVLDLAVSRFLFEHYPALPEGDLTRIRSEVVSERGLAAAAGELCLGDYLRLGKGEERSGGRQKASLRANAFEALFGAIFRDAGFETAYGIALSLLRERIRASVTQKTWTDYKTRLQELFQARYGRPPAYHLASAVGPDHDRIYQAEVLFDDEVIGRGTGRTKKSAEQDAARAALATLES